MLKTTKTTVDLATTLPRVTIISGDGHTYAQPFLIKSHRLPSIIFAAMVDRTLGDFLCRNYFAAAIKLNHGRARLTAYYRDDRPYKKDIISLNPYLDRTIRVSGDSHLPIESFYAAADRHNIPGVEGFIRGGHARPDLVLVPSMMMLEDLARFRHMPVFAIPEARRAGLEERLVQHGLDPSRWFACIFYRQPNYKFRGPTHYRDVNDLPFEQLTNWIIDELGGQVVRIGHPQMRRFSAGRGFVDLSMVEDDFMLHAVAVSRARFMVVTPSGPAMLPGVFGVPFAMTNAISILGAWDPSHLLLPRHVFSPSGERLPVQTLMGNALWYDYKIRELTMSGGHELADNTIEELCAVTRMLYDSTTSCVGWREPPKPYRVRGAGAYVVPEPFRRPLTIVEFPDLAPKKPSDCGKSKA